MDQARTSHPGEAGHPARLAALSDPPARLWVRGRLPGPEAAVAIVGARAATLARIEEARGLAVELARAGVTIVSGGALGIDAAAHQGALEAGGTTVAVLGAGIDVAYPQRHAALFQRIVAADGALVSEYPPGTPPQKGQFPVRNRIIAALADLVIVVEASELSGSLHTARAARRIGRRLAAMPGSSGCDRLILDGATPIASAKDALDLLAGREPEAPAPPAGPDEARLYAALDRVPRDLGELAARAGLGVSACASLAIDLELGGWVARATGGRYVRLR